jgi:prolyl oligopeptidase PreP (S9A serine peptidase family)
LLFLYFLFSAQPSTLYLANAHLGHKGVAPATDAAHTNGAKLLKSLPPQFNSSGLVELQYEASSKDGTRIPYFIVCKSDLTRDGSNPTLLYGYGGFGA